jgi:plasmid maintenance system antidote protein VapI
MGKRRGEIPRVRSKIGAIDREVGILLTGMARLLGVPTSAISKILRRIAEERR